MKPAGALALCVLLSAPPRLWAQPPERLFFSAGEREAMEARRRAAARPAAGANLSFEGFVLRANGAGTVWTNGVAQPAIPAPGSVTAIAAPRRPAVIAVRIGSDTVRVPVGGAMAAEDGSLRDLVPGGAVAVHR